MFGPWLVAWKMKRVGMLGKVAVSQVNSNNLNRSGPRSTATAGIKICSTATGLGTVQQQSQVKAKVNSNSQIDAKVNSNGQVKGTYVNSNSQVKTMSNSLLKSKLN